MHCKVAGRVQGVFFRASTQDEARRLNLHGWVRNLPDSRVEVFASGSPDQIQKLSDWLRQGPPYARVDEIEFFENEIDNEETLKDFLIR